MRDPQIVKEAYMPPHVCFKCKCGSHARPWFVDLGMDTEYDGTFYLCNSCMEDLGRQTNMFMSQQVFDDNIASFRMELEQLRTEYTLFTKMKDLWESHFPSKLVDFFKILEDTGKLHEYGTTGYGTFEPREPDVEGEQSSSGDNVIELVPNSSDSSGSSEEPVGKTITAPVIPLFS